MTIPVKADPSALTSSTPGGGRATSRSQSRIDSARGEPSERRRISSEDDIADDIRYVDGQMASEMAATRMPATAAAAPFFVASAVSTRTT